MRQSVLELEKLAKEMDEEGIRQKLRELVPEYQPAEGGDGKRGDGNFRR